MPYAPVTHVIFDMDGLLLDTEKLYTESIQKVVNEYGKEFTWEVKVRMMGMTTQEGAEYIIRQLELPISPDEYISQTKQMYAQVFPNTELLPGADKLIRHLHRSGVPIAVATSSSEASFILKTTNHRDLFSLFHHIVMGTDDPEVKEGKPSPDIFLVCANRFETRPESPKECLVFEDSPSGAEAGLAAAMQVVMVPDPRVEKGILDKVTKVLTSLEQFIPEEFGLPPYPQND